MEPLWGLCTYPHPHVSPQRAAQCHSGRHSSQVTLCARLMRLWTHTADFTMFLFTNTNKRGLHYAQSSVPKCHEVRRTLGVCRCSNKTLTRTSGHQDGVQAAPILFSPGLWANPSPLQPSVSPSAKWSTVSGELYFFNYCLLIYMFFLEKYKMDLNDIKIYL